MTRTKFQSVPVEPWFSIACATADGTVGTRHPAPGTVN